MGGCPEVTHNPFSSLPPLLLQRSRESLVKSMIQGKVFILASLVAQMVKNLPASTEDAGLIPGSGRFPGEGHGNPLHYFCLENSMDREPGEL